MTSRDTSPWALRPGGYGQTEVVGMMTYNCLGLGRARHPRSRARRSLQMRVVDADDHERRCR